jgi:endonuclease/exonuclease/phosphatase family metal-dependent hydrolase
MQMVTATERIMIAAERRPPPIPSTGRPADFAIAWFVVCHEPWLWMIAALLCGGCERGEPQRADVVAEANETNAAPAPRPRAPEPVPTGTPSIRVMTFNLNYGFADDPANMAAIVASDADVVLLQESTAATEAALRSTMAQRFPHMQFRDCCTSGGLAILSRFAIVEDEYIPSPVRWFPAWRFVLDASIGPTQVLVVHLRPPVTESGDWVKGRFTTPVLREREITTYWGRLDAALPTLIVGDFNEAEDGSAMAILLDKGFRSVLPEYAPDAHTWEWETSLRPLRARLDHIVYGPGLRPHDARVIAAGNSDHRPVVAVFTSSTAP